MMLKSNYDNRFGGVGIDVKAGAAVGKIIICKHDSKLKKIGKTKRRATTLDSFPVFGAKSDSKASQMAANMSRYPEKSNPKFD